MRAMRRKDKQISREEAQALLETGEYGILSTADSSGQPYGIPLNYVYANDAIYFHCAMSGHKLDNIADNSRVSFCVVGDTTVRPADFSTDFISTIVFGTASVTGGEERHNALVALVEKYSPDYIKEGEPYIRKHDKATNVIKIEIHEISGKKAPAEAQ